MTQRSAFVLRVRPEKIDEYVEAHAKVWPEMLQALRETAERAARDAGSRAVVIRGEGPAFLAGGDVTAFHSNRPRLPELVREGASELHRAVLALRRAPIKMLRSHGRARSGLFRGASDAWRGRS